jgi:acyl-coenzyme A thioesterase PaaI-like protein
MSGQEEGGAEWRVAAAALADELRGVTEALATHALEPAALARAEALVREARGLLSGPRRARWYDAGGHVLEITEETARAYLDQSPIRGRLNPVAPPLSIELGARPDGTPLVVGHARLSMSYEGPPHGVHGGWVAALFDDVLGAAQWLIQSRGVTARLTVQYRHVTPVEEDLRFEAWIERREGRRVVARATCHAGDTLTAEAEALFLTVDFRQIQRKMQTRRGLSDPS